MPAPAARLPRAILTALAALALLTTAVVPASAQSATCGFTPEEGYRMLFDGTAASTEDWKMAGPGSFTVADCALRTAGGMGLYWYAGKAFESYSLKLEWKLEKLVDNSGVFVGFPDPGTDPWVAVNQGYEIQIDQIGRSDGAPRHFTGAIYDIQGPDMPKVREAVKPLDWNTYEIIVDDPMIKVVLNGVLVNTFISSHPARDLSSGFFGLQNHGAGEVKFFRNIRIKELEPGSVAPAGSIANLTAARNNVGIAHLPNSGADFDGGGFSYSGLALRNAGVESGSHVSAGGYRFLWPTASSGQFDNVIATGQVVPVTAPRNATALGLLAAADHGPSMGAIELTYVDADGDERTVTRTVVVSDWTLNAGTSGPSAGNVVAVTTPFRMASSRQPELVDTNVFAVTVPLDPTMRLTAVTLPAGKPGRIHIFDLAVK